VHRRWWIAPIAASVLAGPVAVDAQQRPTALPPLPLTQLDERSSAPELDDRTFNLTFAHPVPVRDLLLLIVRGTSLSIVPDPGIDGSFIGELKNVTIRQALALILQPYGLDYRVDGTIVRVFRRQPETRMFDINYIASVRTGESLVSGDGTGRTHAGVSTATRTDVFSELAAAVKALLSEKAAFSIDRKAGLLQVTDVPERLDRVAVYLDAMHERVHRQIQVEAQVVEVELNDETAAGVDWRAVRAQLGASASPTERTRRALTGMRATDLTKLLEALSAQGAVTTIANPTLLAVNNEPAIVQTETLAVSVTPQAAGDGTIMLAVTPVVKASAVAIGTTGKPTAADIPLRPLVAEADVLARVADGETLVLAGFTRDRGVREDKHLGAKGGWFGRGTVVTRRRVELVVLLTPRVVVGMNVQ
jgi:type II secretory pathway component GspD/PulD (secretin)